MARPRTRPLKLTLKEASQVAKQLYEDYGGKASLESLSTITGNTPTSSTFRYKVLALKSFGIIDERDDTVFLTNIGKGLVAPVDPDEAPQAVARAFLEVPEYGEFHGRYAGKLLPDRDKLPNILHRELDIDKDYADEWAAALQEDLETANLVTRRGSQMMVLTAPETTLSQKESPASGRLGQPASRSTENQEAGQTLNISLPGGGQAVISVPENVTTEDVGKMVRVIQALGPPENEPEKEG